MESCLSNTQGTITILSSLKQGRKKKKGNPAHACNFKATHEEISIILYPRDGGLFIE